MTSMWRDGVPEGEGAKRTADGQLVRTIGGDGRASISEDEASAITASFGMRRPLTRSRSFGAARTVARSDKPPLYVGDAKHTMASALRRSKSFSRLNPTPAERHMHEPGSWREPPAWR